MSTISRQELIDAVTEYINDTYLLNQADKAFIAQQIKCVDINAFTNKKQIIPALSKIIIERLKKKSVDIKEYMKSNIGQAQHQINDRLAPQNLKDLLSQPKTAQSIFNPIALERTAYLKLDSQSATLNNTYYTWQISSVSNSVFTPQALSNVVRVRMLPLVIPHVEAYGSTITVDIMEINNQTYRDNIAPRYAFVFQANPLRMIDGQPALNSPVLLTDLSLTTEIHLINPLAELTQVSVGFFNPYAPCVWANSITQATVSAVGNLTRLTFATPPMLALGDLIIVSGWRALGYNIIAVTDLTADIQHTLTELPGIVTVQLCSKQFTVHLEIVFLPGF